MKILIIFISFFWFLILLVVSFGTFRDSFFFCGGWNIWMFLIENVAAINVVLLHIMSTVLKLKFLGHLENTILVATKVFLYSRPPISSPKCWKWSMKVWLFFVVDFVFIESILFAQFIASWMCVIFKWTAQILWLFFLSRWCCSICWAFRQIPNLQISAKTSTD